MFPLKKVSSALLVAALLIRAVPAFAETVHFEPQVKMDLLFVKGGGFTMGDFSGEGTGNEKPAHEVSVSDYFLGRHEVTVGQFRLFTERSAYVTEAERTGSVIDIDPGMNSFVRREGISWKNPGFAQNDDDPAVWVSWNDADAFCRWLAAETGRPYRLPSEAEWEYAARGRGQRHRWAGTSLLNELNRYAWHAGNSGGRPHPAGKKHPNELGFHDMSGNVWEWCIDWQEPYLAGEKVSVDPMGSFRGKFKVLRGGSWRVGPDVIRTTYRNGYKPDYAHSSIGFRIAMSGRGHPVEPGVPEN